MYMVFAIIAITLGIIALVLYLIIHTTILKKRKELGIQMALGFTNRQLMLLTASSFQPLIIFGVALGATIAAFGMNNIVGLLFASMGIMKADFFIYTWMIIFVILLFSVFTFIISLIAAKPIQKITPVELFN